MAVLGRRGAASPLCVCVFGGGVGWSVLGLGRVRWFVFQLGRVFGSWLWVECVRLSFHTWYAAVRCADRWVTVWIHVHME